MIKQILSKRTLGTSFRIATLAESGAFSKHVQGLVHLNLTSMGFCCITDLLLPRANNLILFMSIQPARNPLGKFVEH